MKLSGKTVSSFLVLGTLGALVGSLAWELAERIAANIGLHLDLSIGPIGFDLHVVALHFLVNPGTFLGLLGGFLIFRFL
ncbi:MAG: hypothetical protein IMZ54_00845 [Acidobacteria bacterium]|jgi:hypothetical protein|nr:hypothetical protein [Acidobacteriota bacterium]